MKANGLIAPNNNHFPQVEYIQTHNPRIMKLRAFYPALLLILLISLPGCEVIGDIFKAGVWTGVLLIAVAVAVIIFIIGKLGSKK